MIAERIRCTEADLSAAYRMQGLRPPDGSGDGSAAPASISPDSGLVGSHGSLTAVARMILPVLAHPQRIITVSSTTVGQATANAAMILAPYSGGPYVVRGDRDGQVDLVARLVDCRGQPPRRVDDDHGPPHHQQSCRCTP